MSLIPVYFENHLGEVFHFREKPSKIKSANLHSYAWDINETSYGGRISASFGKASATYELELAFQGAQAAIMESMERLYSIGEKDIIDEKPGRLWFNGYYLKSYISASETSPTDDGYTSRTISVYAPNPMWTKENRTEFRRDPEGAETYGLDYNFDYAYDFSYSGNSRLLYNDSYKAADFCLVIYGPVNSPEVFVNNHSYKVNASIGTGEKIVIDTINKTITKYDVYGDDENIFYLMSKEDYIFEKIPSTQLTEPNVITWNDTFDFDFILFDERSEPAWT